MVTVDESVRSLLRSSEELKVTLEAAFVPNPEDSRNVVQNRRILAVVTHRDDWNLTEEGRFKPATAGSEIQEELDIIRVFPIFGEFTIVMGQTRRRTLDLAPHEQPRSGFNLTITPAEGLVEGSPAPTFFTQDVQSLRLLVAECKRVREVCDVDSSTSAATVSESSIHFGWLRSYFKPTTSSVLKSTPQDLRTINRPLHYRLSPASAGFPGDDAADIHMIRDNWIRHEALRLCRKGRRTLNLRTGTFNVNGKLPSQDLSSWVQQRTSKDLPALPPLQTVSPFSFDEVMKNPFDTLIRSNSDRLNIAEEPIITEPIDSDPDPDILVLGFQELDLSAEALLYSTSTTREDAWNRAIFAALGEKAVRYEKLTSKQLVGMLLIVIVKKHLKPYFKDIKSVAAGAGILGVMGNKGGTAVRFTFTPPAVGVSDISYPGPTTLTFVNAHLAAFEEMVEKRNSDFQDLARRLTFEGAGGGVDPNSPAVEESDSSYIYATSVGQLVPVSIYESDALFWLGDLNYRIDLPDSDVRRILEDPQWDNKVETLWRYDQLRRVMQDKKAFEGFYEYPISHMPSYRFSPGVMMDKLGYDLKRKPAWTDRILHLVGPTCQVQQLSYTSHPQIVMSDHRPVAADFTVNVDLFDSEYHKATVMKLYRQVDMMEDSHERPLIKVDETFLDFGKVFYEQRVTRHVTLQNIGKSPCAYRFVPIQVDSPIHPDWLKIEPMTGLLLPNESAQISLSAFVDNAAASVMNLRRKDLSGTLILHTITGKDHFISVSGEYQYTCFANKLSTLTRLPGPIRSLSSPSALRPEGQATNAPREVMRLVNWMMTSSANDDGLFVTPADDGIVATIRECLDTGDEFPFPPENSEPKVCIAFSITLLRFLSSLVEPILPTTLHSRCVHVTNRDEAFELLDAVPPASVNVWISVTAYLHYICQSSKQAQMSKVLATIFASILLRDDPDSINPPVSPVGKRQFLLHFIT